jgi:hypothetical protein
MFPNEMTAYTYPISQTCYITRPVYFLLYLTTVTILNDVYITPSYSQCSFLQCPLQLLRQNHVLNRRRLIYSNLNNICLGTNIIPTYLSITQCCRISATIGYSSGISTNVMNSLLNKKIY